MRSHHLHPLLLFLPILTSALTNKGKKHIVDKHNFYRTQTDPPATNMRTLSWDSSLEDLATSYAAKCIWEHNEERGFRGENLFLMSGSRLDVDMGLADWFNEKDFYNFTANTCQEGKMCGHYTQMVWADTERVGCGEKFCETIEGFEDGNMYLLVCNYEPPGNFQGQKPYEPGAPCAACPPAYTCKGSLCVDDKQMESGTDGPDTASEVAPYTTETVPGVAADTTHGLPVFTPPGLVPDTVSVLIEEKQSETTLLEADITTSKMESDTAEPPLTTSEPTSVSLAVPTSEPILDLMPPSTESSSPQTPRDLGPQVPLGTSVFSATDMPQTSMSRNPPTQEHPSTAPPTQEHPSTAPPTQEHPSTATPTQEHPSTAPPTQEHPSIATPTQEHPSTAPPIPEHPSTAPPIPEHPSIATPTQEHPSIATPIPELPQPIISYTSPAKDKLDEDISVLEVKDQAKDSSIWATPKSPKSPPKERKKGQNPNSDPKAAQKVIKEKEKQQKKFNKKDQLHPKYDPKGIKWGLKAVYSERSYFGKQVYGPPFIQAYRPPCPYPCVSPPWKFPLHRTNDVSPHKEPGATKPCKRYGYTRGIYSLYRPPKTWRKM